MDQVHCLSAQCGREWKRTGSVLKNSFASFVCGFHPFTGNYFPFLRVYASCYLLIIFFRIFILCYLVMRCVQKMFFKNILLSAYMCTIFASFFDYGVFRFLFFSLSILCLCFLCPFIMLVAFRIPHVTTVFVYCFHVNSGKLLEHHTSLGFLLRFVLRFLK